MTRWIVAGSVGLALAAVLAPAAHAQKTLVYCSEGSPEGFSPALYTAGTTFDASSRQIYNRLVEFEPGTTNIGPGLAESWTVSDDGLEYTFNLRQNVAFHTTEWFTPVPAVQCRRRDLQLRAAVEGGSPVPRRVRRHLRVLQLDGFPGAAEVDR